MNITNIIENLFFDHPNNVCLNYLDHLIVSLSFSKELFFGSIKAIIHALVPYYYNSSTSDINKFLDENLINHCVI